MRNFARTFISLETGFVLSQHPRVPRCQQYRQALMSGPKKPVLSLKRELTRLIMSPSSEDQGTYT